MVNAEIDVAVKKAVQREDSRRRALFINAKDRFERYALASGSHVIGRSETGRPVKTRTPSSLGITINNWLVRMDFKRDDVGALKNRGWREVEEEAKAGTVPTQLVVTENHIITAVRELKHVREGYSKEIMGTRTLVTRIISLNLSVANRPQPVSDNEIAAVIAGLKELRPIIASKDSPLKQIVSLGRLDEAIRRFELASSPEKRPLELGRACAVLNSVPERLTAWRDKRIAGGVAYTYHRETALRVERDKWVYSQLARFSSSIKRVREFSDEDEAKKKALQRVKAMLDDLHPLQVTLKRLRKTGVWTMGDETELTEAKKARDESADPAALSDLRKTIRRLGQSKKRKMDNTMKLVAAEKEFRAKKADARSCLWANAGLFVKLSTGKKPSYLYGDYGALQREISQGRIEEARARLGSMILFLDSNKPRFILDQLSESPDRYLAPVLTEMRPAVEAFEAKDLKTAQRHFAQAAGKMRDIVFPEPR